MHDAVRETLEGLRQVTYLGHATNAEGETVQLQMRLGPDAHGGPVLAGPRTTAWSIKCGSIKLCTR